MNNHNIKTEINQKTIQILYNAKNKTLIDLKKYIYQTNKWNSDFTQ